MNEHRCRRLQELLYKEVPLCGGLGVGVDSYDGKRLELLAELKPNINIHGVAFGGSIYSVCALSGWGLLILLLEEHGLDPRIMITAAQISYLKPVRQRIKASSCLRGQNELAGFVEKYNDKLRARIKVPVEVRLDSNEVAARFTGEYIAFARP